MAEEIIDAFMSIDKRRIDHPDLIYRGGSCTLMQKDDTSIFLDTPMMEASITHDEYDEASRSIAVMLEDPRIKTALSETSERYGAI